MRTVLLTIGSCFGLGLGLASTTPVAHACSCGAGKSWSVQLATIDGQAESGAEQEFWPEAGRISPFELDVTVDLFDADDELGAAPRLHLVLVQEQVQ